MIWCRPRIESSSWRGRQSARIAVDRAFAVFPEDPAVLRARASTPCGSAGGRRQSARVAGPAERDRQCARERHACSLRSICAELRARMAIGNRSLAHRGRGRNATLVQRAALRSTRSLPGAGSAKPKPSSRRSTAVRSRINPPLGGAARIPQGAPRARSADTWREPESFEPQPSKIPTVDVLKLPKLDTSPAPEVPGDFRARLSQAASALHQGDLAHAQQLYQSVLDEQPGQHRSALSGLGDVAKARHNPTLAAEMYDRVLTANPSYLPAILASADQKWDAGDRKGAVVLYRRLLDQASPSSGFGARAGWRASPKARRLTAAGVEQEHGRAACTDRHRPGQTRPAKHAPSRYRHD